MLFSVRRDYRYPIAGRFDRQSGAEFIGFGEWKYLFGLHTTSDNSRLNNSGNNQRVDVYGARHVTAKKLWDTLVGEYRTNIMVIYLAMSQGRETAL